MPFLFSLLHFLSVLKYQRQLSCHIQVRLGRLKALQRKHSLKVSSANKERELVRTRKIQLVKVCSVTHTHLAIPSSQKNTHILQMVWLKNAILNKVKQNRLYCTYWKCLVRCQLVYSVELFFRGKCVPNESWRTASIRG